MIILIVFTFPAPLHCYIVFVSVDTKIEDNSRAFKLQKANFDSEVNTAKAEAQLAYELQAAKIQQRIKQEELQIQVSRDWTF